MSLKQILITVGITAIASGVGGFLTGRNSAAGKIEYKDREIRVVHELQAINHYQQVDVKELLAQAVDIMKKNNVVTERTIIKEGGKETVTERIADTS
jgi:hypothetical protein